MDRVMFSELCCFTIVCFLTVLSAELSPTQEDYRYRHCQGYHHLSDRQRAVCDSDAGHGNFQAMKAGGTMALKHCQRVMRFEKFNCTDLIGDRMTFYALDDGVTKEAAFVTAIRGAGLYYAVLKGYQDDQLPCHYRITDLPETRAKELERYTKCHFDAWGVVENYIALDSDYDTEPKTKTLTLLNVRYAIKTVNELIQSVSRPLGDNRWWCCGLYSMPPFTTIADHLFTAYKTNTKMVFLDGTGSEGEITLDLPPVNLKYVEKSCDRCSPGLRSGRLCYEGHRYLEAKRHCGEVCCGGPFTVVPNMEVDLVTNCHFPVNRGCCDEVCDVATEVATKYYCAIP